jgi:hypothetical protein
MQNMPERRKLRKALIIGGSCVTASCALHHVL